MLLYGESWIILTSTRVTETDRRTERRTDDIATNLSTSCFVEFNPWLFRVRPKLHSAHRKTSESTDRRITHTCTSKFLGIMNVFSSLQWLLEYAMAAGYIQGGPIKSKPQSFVHIFAKYWPIFKFVLHCCILLKNCSKVGTKHTTTP